MAFGKRTTVPGKATSAQAAPTTNQAAVQPAPVMERAAALRDVMLRLLGETGNVAEAIRCNGSVRMPGMDDEIDAEGPPLSLRGFHEHFATAENGQAAYSVFVYASAHDFGVFDPAAQVHLHQLNGRIMDLNRFCQQAQLDGALGVALQSPKLPPQIDRILVGTAFFAALFDTVMLTQLHVAGKTMRVLPADTIASVTDSFERHKLMAFDRMLAPHSLAELLPSKMAPIYGVETIWKAHAGQRFINGVYFPVEQGRPLVTAGAA